MLGHEPNLPQVPIDPAEDLALLPYSSGTTGLPKGVMLTHRNLIANALQLATGPIDWREGEIAAAIPPMFHAYGICLYFGALMRFGSTVVSMARFDFEQFLQIVERYRATFTPLVPPVALALAHSPLVDKYDLSSLRVLASGAAPLAETVALAAQQRLGVTIQEGYGMTELSGATHVQAVDDPKTSVGRALPGVEWKVVDPSTGVALRAGERGEIWIRGPNVMKGYFGRAEESAATIDPEGWLRTGDLGYADGAGRCCIVDRLKELIKFKGYQVAPVELEALLLSHPQVADACVIPQPDAEVGEVPKAFVVGKGTVSADALMQFVASNVAPHKRIRAVEFIDALPRSPAGKLLRRVLVERERVRARHGAGAPVNRLSFVRGQPRTDRLRNAKGDKDMVKTSKAGGLLPHAGKSAASGNAAARGRSADAVARHSRRHHAKQLRVHPRDAAASFEGDKWVSLGMVTVR